MAKTGRAPQLRVVTPSEPITDAPTPILVRFQINWQVPFHTDVDLLQDGWAIAWSAQAVLVVWRVGPDAQTAWLPADHVRRLW